MKIGDIYKHVHINTSAPTTEAQLPNEFVVVAFDEQSVSVKQAQANDLPPTTWDRFTFDQNFVPVA
jgi:hypothetical protein